MSVVFLLLAVGVALRKESVDRNVFWKLPAMSIPESLSARRAWIEMCFGSYPQCPYRSLSARRAWIEIIVSVTANVDGFCRSPQGERG